MNKTTLRLTISLFACGLGISALAQVAQTDLEKVLQQADKRRQEYVEAFKDLTAVETKTTELFDKNGKVEKQRKVVSDFLVYPLQTRADAVDEYRITREVDGKPVGKGERQAIELFQSLAKAKTIEQEAKRLRDENLKHTLKYYRWGITLQPAKPLEKQFQRGYEFEILGREKLGGRDIVLLRYQMKERIPTRSNLTRDFTNPKTAKRGRVWLDAEDFRLRRWEDESTVVDQFQISEAVYMRDEIEYEPSSFGILVPKSIVTAFFDRQADKRSMRLAARITNTYADFKRFDVRTESETPKLKP